MNNMPMDSQFTHLPSVNLYLVAASLPSCRVAIRSMLAGASGGVSGSPVGEGLNDGETATVERSVERNETTNHLLPVGALSLGGRRLLADLNYEICV